MPDTHFSNTPALFKTLSATVTTPTSGSMALYAKTDLKLYYKDETGVETIIASIVNNNLSANSIYSNQISETFQTYSATITANATITLNCSTGNIWNITSPISGNWTASLTNVPVTTNQATNVVLMINPQGTTAYIPSAVSINGNSATIKWQGGVVPAGNSSKVDIFSFSILQTAASTYVTLGQLVTFG